MDDWAGDGGGSGSGDSAKIIAKMGEPDEFPKDAASELLDAAEWLDDLAWVVGKVLNFGTADTFAAVVKMCIDNIQSILGDHTVARELAITWGTCTTVADVKQDLTSAKGELDSYWENSGAKEGFNTYFGSVTDALDTAKDKFEKMSDTLVNSIRYIYDTYGDAVNFLYDAASSSLLFSPATTSEAIYTLVDKLTDLMAEAAATTGNFAADATTVQTIPSQFEEPAALPGSVENPDSWHVNPA